MDRRELNEFRRRARELPIGRIIVGAVALAVIAVIVAAPFTMFYTVDASEVGVVLRFGKYAEQVSPGLHWKLPFGIDSVHRVPIEKVMKEEFGFRTQSAGINTRYEERAQLHRDESNMLTGDLKMADVEWVVQFKVLDPKLYLFAVRSPDATLRDVSEATMRQIVGDYSMADVLTAKRAEIEQKAQEKLQNTLRVYDSGIQIITVKLQNVNPPTNVKKAFNEVNQARQEKETTINEAQKAYFKAVPSARGEAQRMISEAQGFQAKRVNEALGNVAKFSALLEEYEKSKDVTRSRLYLETLEEVLPRLQKIYVIDGASGDGAPLQVLDLKDEGAAVRASRERKRS